MLKEYEKSGLWDLIGDLHNGAGSETIEDLIELFNAHGYDIVKRRDDNAED